MFNINKYSYTNLVNDLGVTGDISRGLSISLSPADVSES